MRRANDAENGAKELHVVYAEPRSGDAYRKTGAFPDGAVLVKDVFATRTEALTTGLASCADKPKGRFVTERSGGQVRRQVPTLGRRLGLCLL